MNVTLEACNYIFFIDYKKESAQHTKVQNHSKEQI